MQQQRRWPQVVVGIGIPSSAKVNSPNPIGTQYERLCVPAGAVGMLVCWYVGTSVRVSGICHVMM